MSKVALISLVMLLRTTILYSNPAPLPKERPLSPGHYQMNWSNTHWIIYLKPDGTCLTKEPGSVVWTWCGQWTWNPRTRVLIITDKQLGYETKPLMWSAELDHKLKGKIGIVDTGFMGNIELIKIRR